MTVNSLCVSICLRSFI